MENKELTVVIPVYNRERWLPRTLASVAAQTNRSFHLILVDNGSTDGSWAMCDAFRREHTDKGEMSVTLVREERSGASCARNCGLALCATPYIYFFDSDDEMSPDFVETLLPELSDRPDAVMLTTVQTDGHRERVRAYSCTESPAVHILNAMLSTVSMVLRTDFLRTIGGWKETLRTWDDWELGVRVLLARPRLHWYVRRPFHRIWLHPESQTGSGFSSTWPWLERAMRAAGEDVRRLLPPSEERRRCELALYYRYAILRGKLYTEGDRSAAGACRHSQEKFLFPSLCHRMAATLLYVYTARGGRGAWRLALKLL